MLWWLVLYFHDSWGTRRCNVTRDPKLAGTKISLIPYYTLIVLGRDALMYASFDIWSKNWLDRIMLGFIVPRAYIYIYTSPIAN